MKHELAGTLRRQFASVRGQGRSVTLWKAAVKRLGLLKPSIPPSRLPKERGPQKPTNVRRSYWMSNGIAFPALPVHRKAP